MMYRGRPRLRALHVADVHPDPLPGAGLPLAYYILHHKDTVAALHWKEKGKAPPSLI